MYHNANCFCNILVMEMQALSQLGALGIKLYT